MEVTDPSHKIRQKKFRKIDVWLFLKGRLWPVNPLEALIKVNGCCFNAICKPFYCRDRRVLVAEEDIELKISLEKLLQKMEVSCAGPVDYHTIGCIITEELLLENRLCFPDVVNRGIHTMDRRFQKKFVPCLAVESFHLERTTSFRSTSTDHGAG